MSEPNPPAGSTSRFPLAAVFSVTAVCAVLFGMLRMVFTASASSSAVDVGVAAILGLILGAFFGWWIGTYHRRWFLGGMLGAAAGGVVGLLVTPLVAVRSGALAELWLTLLIGSGLLVAAGLTTRYSSASDAPRSYLGDWRPPIEAQIVEKRENP